jgi:succinate dehydrogenase/fumarate reductase cytochrome b subunit
MRSLRCTLPCQDLNMRANRSSVIPKTIIAVFLAVAVLMLAIAAISAARSGLALAKEATAQGSVVDLVLRTDQTGNQFYYPVVAFTLPDGSRQTIQIATGSGSPAYKQDESVTIAYDPEQPRNARISSFSNTASMWILPLITGVLGAAFLAATLFARRVLGADSEQVRRSGDSRPNA